MIWPNQAKSAFNLGFDLDGETIWRNKARRLPGGDSFLKGPSIGGYGPRKGAYRILEILKEFDFMETFNACESQEVNGKAQKIADKYGLTGTGGSDAHRQDCVGLAYTEIPDDITCESDLITEIMKGTKFECGGTNYTGTTKEKIGKVNTVLVHSFWVYNKLGGLSKAFQRNTKMKKGFVEHVQNPIRKERTNKVIKKEDKL